MRKQLIALLMLSAVFGFTACSEDDDDGSNDYSATLTGGAEKPIAVNTTAIGTFELSDNGSSMTYSLSVNAITGPITGAHIHAIPRSGAAPADTTGGIVVNLNPNTAATSGVLATGTITQASILGLQNAAPISMDSLRALMNAGRTYVNVHTAANLSGHIRGTIVRD